MLAVPLITLSKYTLQRDLILRGFLQYTIRLVLLVEKRLVCNRKGPICKDLTVEINSMRLVF
jgi:hypothetical protein